MQTQTGNGSLAVEIANFVAGLVIAAVTSLITIKSTISKLETGLEVQKSLMEKVDNKLDSVTSLIQDHSQQLVQHDERARANNTAVDRRLDAIEKRQGKTEDAVTLLGQSVAVLQSGRK